MWTSTKQWPYYLLNVVLPPRLHSSFNTPSSLGVHISDTLASSLTPNSFSHFVKHKATGVFLKLFPLLARDSALSSHNKITLYKLLIRPVLTYAAPVWRNTSSSNYRHLQLLKSTCFRVIGSYPRRTPIPHLHSALNLETIHEFIYRLTDKFFRNSSTHANPLVRQIGIYTLPNFYNQYRKYIHKRTKHLLL